MTRLQRPEFTADGYPTEQTLQAIREWPIFETGLRPLLEFMQKAWKYQDYARERDGLWTFSTGGWSGNEELIATLDSLPWQGLARSVAWFNGGHYVIAVTKEADAVLRKAQEDFWRRIEL